MREKNVYHPLRKKCPYSEFFWSAFSRIRTEYGDLLHKSPYSIQMPKSMDQKNSEYGHFLGSDRFSAFIMIIEISEAYISIFLFR